MNVIPLQQANQNFNQLFEQLVQDTEPTIVSSTSGQSVVIMTLEEFNSWQETFYLQSASANAAWPRESIQQYKAGNLVHRSVGSLIDT